MPGDVWALYGQPELRATPAPLPDAHTIPPREWLLGTWLLRRFVSILAAQGGAGKSALALAAAVSLATGRTLIDEYVHHRTPVWLMNLEDPADEVNRRLAALMQLHGIPRHELDTRLFVHHGRDRRLLMAAESQGGFTYPDQDIVIEQAKAQRIGLIIVDPFVKSHTLEENDNSAMDAAVTAWSEVAERANLAVLLVHHVRKPGTGGADTSVDAARGAKSLTDAARSARILTPMSRDEAERLGIAQADRARLTRLTDAKANLAPLRPGASWLRLEQIALGNGTEHYPNGDTVAAITPWKPPSLWAAHSAPELNRVLDRLADGPAPGTLYAPTRRGRALQRWAGTVLMHELGLNETQAAEIITTWIQSGTLQVVTYRDPQQRRERTGVHVMDTHRPTNTLSDGDDE